MISTTVLGVLRVVLEFFREEYKDYGRRTFQSRTLTWCLVLPFFLMLVPASNSARLILSPPIVLRLLPAKGLFMRLEDAVPGQSPDYRLSARYGGSWQSLTLQGAQSVYVGSPENTRDWLRKRAETGSLAEKQRSEMENYLVQVEVPDEDRDFFLTRWKEEPRFLGSHRLEVGKDVEIVVTSSVSAKALVDKKVRIKVRPETQLVFLEIQ